MLLNKLFHPQAAVRPAVERPVAEAKADWQYADNAIPVPEVREDDPDSAGTSGTRPRRSRTR